MSKVGVAGAVSKDSNNRIRQLRQAFRFFDKNDDGSLSTDELSTIMRTLGHFPSMDELKQVLSEFDIDGDGTVTFKDFVKVMVNDDGNSEENEEEELRQTFSVFDKGKCGYITSSNLRAVVQCMGENLSNEEINDMIAEVDRNGDGKIDFEEFSAYMRIDDEEEDDEDDDDLVEEEEEFGTPIW